MLVPLDGQPMKGLGVQRPELRLLAPLRGGGGAPRLDRRRPLRRVEQGQLAKGLPGPLVAADLGAVDEDVRRPRREDVEHVAALALLDDDGLRRRKGQLRHSVHDRLQVLRLQVAEDVVRAQARRQQGLLLRRLRHHRHLRRLQLRALGVEVRRVVVDVQPVLHLPRRALEERGHLLLPPLLLLLWEALCTWLLANPSTGRATVR
mmetsp:Transcript_22164/g.71458  ORF Transcript_22164/g.71458 Transcript_22164/m.71458 type:complete len:205 (-) Transcript_22164:14-628(-)